jgi:hypothetical protein
MSDFLDRALRLKARGYVVVPIQKGHKGPHGRYAVGWQNEDPSEDQLRHLAEGDFRDGNIGINTRFTPAIDIDVYDDAVAQAMEDYLAERYGDICVRVGQAPKRLIVFRTTTPFRKMFASYSDGKTNHKIEVLGNGQQFVAYGTHPDTKKPYTWTSLDEPLGVSAGDLPTLTHVDAQEIIEHFCIVCEERGWKKLSSSMGGVVRDDGDADLDGIKPILALTHEKIEETLDLLPNEEADYDDWLSVGCALHHQFNGGQEGLELWHQWGQRSSKYDAADTNRRWRSFGHGPSTITFATLLYRANEIKSRLEDQAFAAAMNRINSTNDKKELVTKVAADIMASLSNDLQYDEATKRLQVRLGELNDGHKPRVETVRKLLDAQRPKRAARESVPAWCENWFYIESRNAFYNTETSAMLSPTSFDNKFGRMLLTDDMRAKGESFAGKASNVALNVHCVPTVYDAVYMPGEESIVNLNGMDHVNTYNHLRTPLEREPKTADEKAAIKMAERHFELLFPDEFERNTFLDYLAYTVQYPKEKITWGVLIQGVDGAGKTWFRELMSAVLGPANVRGVDATALNEKYTKWAEGSRMVFFEEIRLQGHNRFEILDKLRPFLSNETVNVRRMQTDLYETPNVTNYVMFTNYLDALPINENDRRYFIIRTSFQTAHHLIGFERSHPNYFTDLFNMTAFEGQALRWWLLNREIADDFRAKGRAPHTSARALMIDESESSDDLDLLRNVLEAGEHPLVCDLIVSVKELRALLPELAMLDRRKLGQLLFRAGFAKVGQFRLGGSTDPKDTWYTRNSGEVTPANALGVARRLLGGGGDGFD